MQTLLSKETTTATSSAYSGEDQTQKDQTYVGFLPHIQQLLQGKDPSWLLLMSISVRSWRKTRGVKLIC